MSRRWSSTEDNILRRHYATGGVKAVQESLAKRKIHRSVDAVRQRARRLGVTFDPARRDLVALSEVHPRYEANGPWQAHPHALAAAETAGVLVRVGHMNMVPIEWADEYVDWLAGVRDRERELRGSGWISTREAARMVGVSLSMLAATAAGSVRSKVLARLVEGVRRERVGIGQGTILWHPLDVRTLAVRYARERRQRSSTGALEVERAA